MRKNLQAGLAAGAALVSACLPIQAAGTEPVAVFRSAEGGTSLLELYSSEGCSSCPPADRWVSRLRADHSLWKSFVPVVFHVDYWDYLGWKDALASRVYSERQRAYAQAWGNRSVYTPGFVLDGREFKRWGGASLPAPASRKGRLRVESADAFRHRLVFETEGAAASRGHVALLGFGVVRQVQGGENQGRRLIHDFVTLAYADCALAGGSCALELPRDLQVKAPRLGIAAWVTSADGGPLQAAGGYLPHFPGTK